MPAGPSWRLNLRGPCHCSCPVCFYTSALSSLLRVLSGFTQQLQPPSWSQPEPLHLIRAPLHHSRPSPYLSPHVLPLRPSCYLDSLSQLGFSAPSYSEGSVCCSWCCSHSSMVFYIIINLVAHKSQQIIKVNYWNQAMDYSGNVSVTSLHSETKTV